jgi:hypothetical protein
VLSSGLRSCLHLAVQLAVFWVDRLPLAGWSGCAGSTACAHHQGDATTVLCVHPPVAVTWAMYAL